MEVPISESGFTPDLCLVAHEFADPGEVRGVQRGYLHFFRPGARVLDAGCGRGVFLDLLREAGIEALGLELCETTAAIAREKGHEVAVTDAAEWLATTEERFDGIFCSHLIEHFGPEEVGALVGGIARALAPGGRAVFVTPNPRNLMVLTEVFWLDPTHVRPWPRPVLEGMGIAAGLVVKESFDDPATVPRRPLVTRVLARIRSALSGADRSSPMDSVVVFERP